MNDDQMLSELGAMERAEIERRAPEWEDVAHGRCTPEAAADAIRARDGADDDEIALAQALFAPLPEAFDDALADRLAAQLDRSAATEAEPAGPRVVVRDDRAFWRRAGVGVGVAAAAAALVLVFVRSGTPARPDGDARAQLSALPAFQLGVQAARASVRADHGPEAAVEVAPGDALELLLRPDTRHGETAQVFACLEQGRTRTELPVEIVDGGVGATIVARASIPAATTHGSVTLVAVVATDRPGGDPCVLDDAPTHRVLRTPIVIVAPR